jgi:type III pantothenate kinase
MLLVFDVGNTNIVVGVYKNENLLCSFRMETYKERSADEYGMLIDQFLTYEGLSMEDVTDVIVSTVVPSVLYSIQHMVRKYFKVEAIIVSSEINTGLKISYDNPSQLGSDRIVNAVGALKKYGGPLIVIDFGTATTVCSLTEDWEFLGGTIAPGLKSSSNALFERTAALPKIEIEDPGSAIGRKINKSMQAGLLYGHMGAMEYIVKKMKEEMRLISKTEKEIKVIATGGMAAIIDDGVDNIDVVDKLLTLDGLYYLYEMNKNLF